MSKRISKRVREEAAVLCAIAASNEDIGLSDALIRLGQPVNSGIFGLAHDAKSFACYRGGYDPSDDYMVACAEAEALLRTGWSPS